MTHPGLDLLIRVLREAWTLREMHARTQFPSWKVKKGGISCSAIHVLLTSSFNWTFTFLKRETESIATHRSTNRTDLHVRTHYTISVRWHFTHTTLRQPIRTRASVKYTSNLTRISAIPMCSFIFFFFFFASTHNANVCSRVSVSMCLCRW